MKRILHIVLVLLAAAACQGPRVIPKDTLTDIYTDMFLADQRVRDENVPRARMDTLLLYAMMAVSLSAIGIIVAVNLPERKVSA